MATGTAIIDVRMGQYKVMNTDPAPRERPGRINGLLEAWDDLVTVWTGTSEGPVRLTVEIYDDDPPLALDGWDEVVEVSQFSASGEAVVMELMGKTPDGLPQLELPSDSWFRVRCHARGRDQGAARDRLAPDEDPIEEHLLQMWPAPQAQDVCHRLSDHFGQILRSPSTASA